MPEALRIPSVSDLPRCPLLFLLGAESHMRGSASFLHSRIHHIPPAKALVLRLSAVCFLLWGWSGLPFASAVHTCHSDYSTGSKQGSCFMTRCNWEQLSESQVTEWRPSCYRCGKPLSFFSQVNAVLAKRLLFPWILESLQEWLGGLCFLLSKAAWINSSTHETSLTH